MIDWTLISGSQDVSWTPETPSDPSWNKESPASRSWYLESPSDVSWYEESPAARSWEQEQPSAVSWDQESHASVPWGKESPAARAWRTKQLLLQNPTLCAIREMCFLLCEVDPELTLCELANYPLSWNQESAADPPWSLETPAPVSWTEE